MEFLEVTATNRSTVLELFSKELDEDGFIIEKKTGKRITCPYSHEEVHVDSFSILPGSATFVNNYAFCFAEHRATHS